MLNTIILDTNRTKIFKLKSPCIHLEDRMIKLLKLCIMKLYFSD